MFLIILDHENFVYLNEMYGPVIISFIKCNDLNDLYGNKNKYAENDEFLFYKIIIRTVSVNILIKFNFYRI